MVNFSIAEEGGMSQNPPPFLAFFNQLVYTTWVPEKVAI